MDKKSLLSKILQKAVKDDPSKAILIQIIDESNEKLVEIINTKIKEVKADIPDLNDIIFSIKGKDGEQGADGTTPVKNIDYFDGKDGIEGVDGLPGPKGDKGNDGINGIDGKDGINGKDGVDGKNGTDGLDGSSDSPKTIADKLNTLSDSVEPYVIKGYRDLERITKENAFNPNMGPSFADLENIKASIKNLPRGGSQTPWTSDIDGGGYSLSDVNEIDVISINATDTFSGGFGDETGIVQINKKLSSLSYPIPLYVELQQTVEGYAAEIAKFINSTTGDYVFIGGTSDNALVHISSTSGSYPTALLVDGNIGATSGTLEITSAVDLGSNTISASQYEFPSGSAIVDDAGALKFVSTTGTMEFNDANLTGVASFIFNSGGSFYDSSGNIGISGALDFPTGASISDNGDGGISIGTTASQNINFANGTALQGVNVAYFQGNLGNPGSISHDDNNGLTFNAGVAGVNSSGTFIGNTFQLNNGAYIGYSGSDINIQPAGGVINMYGEVDASYGINVFGSSVVNAYEFGFFSGGGLQDDTVGGFNIQGGAANFNAAGALSTPVGYFASTISIGTADDTYYWDASGDIVANDVTAASFITSGGTSSEVVGGDGSLLNYFYPSGTVAYQGDNISEFTNDSGYITAASIPLGPKIVASGNLLAQSATTSSVTTYTTPNDSTVHSFRVGGYTAITAISAGTLTVSFTFTDENNTSRTLNFFPMGLTSAGLTTTGFDSFPPANIRCKANTAITVAATFTGVSITYDVGGMIESLY